MYHKLHFPNRDQSSFLNSRRVSISTTCLDNETSNQEQRFGESDILCQEQVGDCAWIDSFNPKSTRKPICDCLLIHIPLDGIARRQSSHCWKSISPIAFPQSSQSNNYMFLKFKEWSGGTDPTLFSTQSVNTVSWKTLPRDDPWNFWMKTDADRESAN
jgi:hypothetical protein